MTGEASIVGVFREVTALAAALRRLKEGGFRRLTVHSPVGLLELQALMPHGGSPIRFLTILAGAAGMIGGFWMCIGSALLYGLIVGGKHPVSWLPYCIIGFEGAILVGGVTTFVAMLMLARLRPARAVRRLRATPAYDPRFGVDRYGVCVFCPPAQVATITALLWEAGAEEVHGSALASREDRP
jgi:molybdopterin-containing oxidoreductase family membrane subunit